MATATATLLALACNRPPSGNLASPRPSSAQQWQWPNPAPAVSASALPEQGSLYAVVVAEFARLGWKSVCIGVLPQPTAADAVDPSPDTVAWLSAHEPRFRPKSACRVDGENVIDSRSGSKDGVMVTVVGANSDREDTLVYVQWCCWTGLGTFRLKREAGVWSLRGTEGWLQT